jgi:hypothetical protein
MEYAKKIELNRPSPKAENVVKINFEKDIGQTTAAGKKVFDSETKTFKTVN